MVEERVDDGMIEIGDPTEEPTAPEPAPPRWSSSIASEASPGC